MDAATFGQQDVARKELQEVVAGIHDPSAAWQLHMWRNGIRVGNPRVLHRLHRSPQQPCDLLLRHQGPSLDLPFEHFHFFRQRSRIQLVACNVIVIDAVASGQSRPIMISIARHKAPKTPL
jgi:hypothetical protein